MATKPVDVQLVLTNPRKWLASIEGIGAMLMNRMLNPGEDQELLVQMGKGRGSKTAHDEKERMLWREKLYYSEMIGVYTPGENIHACMQEGAKFWNARIPGDGKRTYTDVIKCACVVEDMPMGDGTPMRKDDETIMEFGKWVSGNPTAGKRSGKVWRIRPLIANWSGKFILHTFDSRLTHEVLETVLGYAGQFKGLNEWRPTFGRFVLTSLEEITGRVSK